MLEVLCVTGGRTLEGRVRVAGAKNAALPLLFATLLSDQPCVLENVPDLEDIAVTLRLLRSLGAQTEYKSNRVEIRTETIRGTLAPYGLVKALRASFWVLGPLLARAGEAQVSLPGGDAIGTRPVDLHLQGLARLGADIQMKHGVVCATAPGGLRGATIDLGFPSVGATHNILMAAVLAKGETVLHGVAREPEVTELASLLTAMGAKISGAGTDTIQVLGVESLGGATHAVLGDRIEAATYPLTGAVTGGRVQVSGIPAEALHSSLHLLENLGCQVHRGENEVEVVGPNRLRATDFETEPYPGLATDVQPLFMAALTGADGRSVVRENVFENRFGHVAEYRRFGARIAIDGRLATIDGVDLLSAAPVEGGDIRAAAGLVLMGLMAEGVTQVRELHHLDRGYDGMVEKLKELGAKVSRIPAFEEKEVVFGC
ncbi:MAG: UDP-N-acetylglucosamine 1-carboxyvinyltransferase [Bdellovibrionales bacterium]|nr:UDP-N-acetylglucosamine 1-carboxyvinyltransferase [Bdellovibrionales bacterium]